MNWIRSDKPKIVSCGWATLSSLVAVKQDDELNIKALSALLDRVENEIKSAPNRVRYTMNGFVIAIGSYVQSLTNKAIESGNKIDKVEVEMGGTAYKVPSSPQYIEKVQKMDRVRKKRKAARC